MKIHKSITYNQYYFWCPACNRAHGLNDRWTYNGNPDSPTFSPSVHVTGTVEITNEEAERILKGEYIKPVPFVCHSFINDGKIQYLSDCTHALAGKTVDLPDWEM